QRALRLVHLVAVPLRKKSASKDQPNEESSAEVLIGEPHPALAIDLLHLGFLGVAIIEANRIGRHNSARCEDCAWSQACDQSRGEGAAAPFNPPNLWGCGALAALSPEPESPRPEDLAGE